MAEQLTRLGVVLHVCVLLLVLYAFYLSMIQQATGLSKGEVQVSEVVSEHHHQNSNDGAAQRMGKSPRPPPGRDPQSACPTWLAAREWRPWRWGAMMSAFGPLVGCGGLFVSFIYPRRKGLV